MYFFFKLSCLNFEIIFLRTFFSNNFFYSNTPYLFLGGWVGWVYSCNMWNWIKCIHVYNMLISCSLPVAGPPLYCLSCILPVHFIPEWSELDLPHKPVRCTPVSDWQLRRGCFSPGQGGNMIPVLIN